MAQMTEQAAGETAILAATPLLSAGSIRLAYGGSTVVENVSLIVRPGQVACVMGRNGAGKTTLMKGIIGSLPLRGGSLHLNGEDISRWPPYRRARAGIGYVPQGRGIFPFLTVLENLQIGLEPLGGKDTGQMAEMFDLFPVLKEMQARLAGLLSGGQQQQLAVARALLSRPKLLLLDEPTEGIQPSIVEQIEDVIRSLRGTMAILLVEQFLDFALAVADHCYVLEHGAVVIDGPPASLDQSALHDYLAV